MLAHGRLKVEDHRLLDSKGDEIQLRGISSHGLEWYPQYTNAGAIKAIVDHGGNVFRLAVYAEYYEQQQIMTAITMAIENALAMDVYVVIDWHVFKEEDPNVYIEQAKDFFSQISAMYPNEPAILYEICNEPNGDTTWEQIKIYADIVIPLIREESPNSVIIVGTPAFSTDLTGPLKTPLSYDNIMYSYHQYSNTMSDNDFWVIDNARRNDLAIFVSEWGFSNRDPNGVSNLEQVGKFLDYLDDNKISWINWSLNNKDEHSAAISSTSNKLSRWSNRDLSDSGRFVFERLAGSNK